MARSHSGFMLDTHQQTIVGAVTLDGKKPLPARASFSSSS
jgi:hypothetical protein